MTDPQENELAQIASVLQREIQIPALESLIYSFKRTPRELTSSSKNAKQNLSEKELEESAIVFDSSAILRISSNSLKSANIIDYLVSEHKMPIVISGQAVLEFWNNYFSTLETIPKSFSKKFQELKDASKRTAILNHTSIHEIEKHLEIVENDHQHLLSPETIRETEAFFEKLCNKAIVPAAPRGGLDDIAKQRKASKTPPGFKDDADGDFYIWVDLLFGLLVEKRKGSNFEKVIFVTNDQKKDWSSFGCAHPILHAEAKAILDADLRICNLDTFYTAF